MEFWGCSGVVCEVFGRIMVNFVRSFVAFWKWHWCCGILVESGAVIMAAAHVSTLEGLGRSGQRSGGFWGSWGCFVARGIRLGGALWWPKVAVSHGLF